jgi:excisionase family DNA binding protein
LRAHRDLLYLAVGWQLLPTDDSWNLVQPMTYKILTLPEVAQLLKLAEKTVYSMAQQGQLPAFKVGGQWRFKRADRDQWIDAQPRGGDGDPK